MSQGGGLKSVTYYLNGPYVAYEILVKLIA
jgi:hypothetical protein